MLIEDTESDKLRQRLSVSLHMYLRLKKGFKVESFDLNEFKIPSLSAVYIVSSPLSMPLAFLRNLTLNFSRMLGDFIAGSLRELNLYDEMF